MIDVNNNVFSSLNASLLSHRPSPRIGVRRSNGFIFSKYYNTHRGRWMLNNINTAKYPIVVRSQNQSTPPAHQHPNSKPTTHLSKPKLPKRSRKPDLSPSAFKISWQICTIRGTADAIIYKFDSIDPLTNKDNSPTRDHASSPSWSNAIKLGVKFPKQFTISITKLQEYVKRYDGKVVPSRFELKHSIFKPYEKALLRLERLQQEGRTTTSDSSSSSEERDDEFGEIYEDAKTIANDLQSNYLEVEDDLGEEERFWSPALHFDDHHQELDDLVANTTVDDSLIDSIMNTAYESQYSAISTGEAPALEETANAAAADAVQSIPQEKEGDDGSSLTSHHHQHQQHDKETIATITTLEASNQPVDDILLIKPSLPQSAATVVMRRCASFFKWIIRSFFHMISFLTSALPCIIYHYVVPYRIRSFFHKPWPPRMDNALHASPTIARLLKLSDKAVKKKLLSTGFDLQGRSPQPLKDLPKWKIEQLVDCSINNVSLYHAALSHSTALPLEMRYMSYQRLEYLGDAVLELCTRQMLMQREPEADEVCCTPHHACSCSFLPLPFSYHLFHTAHSLYSMYPGSTHYERTEPRCCIKRQCICSVASIR